MILKPYVAFICIACLLAGCGGGGNGGSSTQTSSITPAATSSSNSAATSSSSNAVASSAPSSVKNSSSSVSSSKPILLAYGDNSMQVGELRLPSISSEKPFPLVIIIHGGCWVSAYADYHFMDNITQAITNLGYATWNIEYRALGTGGDWPIVFQDVGKAVDYSRTLAQHYPVDASRVAVVGHSAGGHLALWLASRNNVKSDSPLYTQNPLPLRGVISLAGIANVTKSTSCYSVTSSVIGIPLSPESSTLTLRLQDTSPLQMLPTKTKTILISGSADGIVPATIGIEYSTKATELGDDSLHYILQGLGHFDLIDPAKTNWSLYQQSLQEIFKE